MQNPERTPIDPRDYRDWLKRHEAPFLNAIAEVGDDPIIDKFAVGRQIITTRRFTPELEIPTGTGLCDLVSAVIDEATKTRYGQDADILCALLENQGRSLTNVVARNRHGRKYRSETISRHIWRRIRGTDQVLYFVDAVHGQINFTMNRIVFDRVENEQNYYGYQTQPQIFESPGIEQLSFSNDPVLATFLKLAVPFLLETLRD